jgi:hypothetical protein
MHRCAIAADWKVELECEQMFIDSRSLDCVLSVLLLSSGSHSIIYGLIFLLSGGSRCEEIVSINREGSASLLGIKKPLERDKRSML